MNKLKQYLIEKLYSVEFANAENHVFILYGLKVLIMYLLFFISAIIIGLITQRIGIIIIFLFTFMPLRSYAGGYHLPNRIGCFLATCTLLFIVALLSPLLAQADIRLQLVLLVLAGGVIYATAPLGCRNRELDEAETNTYRRIARVLTAIQFVLVPVVWLTPFRLYAEALLFSLLSEATLLIIEYLHRK